MRRDLPAGTITFLFTDIEGSTKLLHELGAEAYAEKLAEHRMPAITPELVSHLVAAQFPHWADLPVTPLAALYKIDPAGGPEPGAHNFFRGGPLTAYDSETREAISALNAEIDTDTATEVCEAALAATWHGPSLWVHGDVTAANLLVVDGRLSAVVDFGCSGVGDPACDLTIAWTFFFGDSREVFRNRLPVG
jgi:aminoglycoside phosphotransferase (APT) family kinase protein